MSRKVKGGQRVTAQGPWEGKNKGERKFDLCFRKTEADRHITLDRGRGRREKGEASLYSSKYTLSGEDRGTTGGKK